MCYNCGCHIPQDNMGHPDNITEDTFTHLAQHQHTSILEVKKGVLEYLSKELRGEKVKPDHHLEEMFEKASKAWGQSLTQAKQNTYNLLKQKIG